MSQRKTNSIRIFWIENGKEQTKRIYPKNCPEKKWENGWELYLFGLTEVCRYFNCLTPDELYQEVRWCYDWLPICEIDPDLSWKEKCDKIYNRDDYKYWYQLKIESKICRATDSMFSDAYRYLKEACKHHEEVIYDRDFEEVDEHLTNKYWKEPFWVNYLFDEYIGTQSCHVPTGAWVFRDGSYITVEAGNHRRIVEGYMGLKESDKETEWVKIQLYKAYTHKRMTDAQKKTLNKLFKQYPDELHESDRLWTTF